MTNLEDERRHTARDYTESVSKRADGSKTALILGLGGSVTRLRAYIRGKPPFFTFAKYACSVIDAKKHEPCAAPTRTHVKSTFETLTSSVSQESLCRRSASAQHFLQMEVSCYP
jgi:hypothetical protein